jgi:hypothetical protein
MMGLAGLFFYGAPFISCLEECRPSFKSKIGQANPVRSLNKIKPPRLLMF